MSLPLRKCGLKRLRSTTVIDIVGVTSLAEVWIETIEERPKEIYDRVTSLAEVWIETIMML